MKQNKTKWNGKKQNETERNGTEINGTKQNGTADVVIKLLNYCATRPGAVVRYKASGVILAIRSGASYLSEPKSCSVFDK